MPKTATFETNRGTITAELYEKDAPKTVENFEKLANSGFYALGALPEVAPHSNRRGTLHPASCAGSNFHFATADFTLEASQGCVAFTTLNVRMSARPSVSTMTVTLTALYFA